MDFLFKVEITGEAFYDKGYIDVGDGLAVFVTETLYLLPLASGTNIKKVSPISIFRHGHPIIVTNIKLPTYKRQEQR